MIFGDISWYEFSFNLTWWHVMTCHDLVNLIQRGISNKHHALILPCVVTAIYTTARCQNFNENSLCGECEPCAVNYLLRSLAQYQIFHLGKKFYHRVPKICCNDRSSFWAILAKRAPLRGCSRLRVYLSRLKCSKNNWKPIDRIHAIICKCPLITDTQSP